MGQHAIAQNPILWLTLTAPDYNANLTTVLYADIVAIACLFIAAASRWRRPRAI